MTGVSLQNASIFALAAAAMCTVRNLERVASPRMENNGAADIRRRKMFDFIWCGIFPFVFSAMRMCLSPGSDESANVTLRLNHHRVHCCAEPVQHLWVLKVVSSSNGAHKHNYRRRRRLYFAAIRFLASNIDLVLASDGTRYHDTHVCQCVGLELHSDSRS